MAPDISGKQLQLLKEAVPKVSRVAILFNPNILGQVLSVKEAQVAAPPLGLTVQPVEVRAPDELGPAFDAMTRERAEALLSIGDPFTVTHQRGILELAAKRRLPSTCNWLESADFLISYGPNRLDMFRRAASFVDKILKGRKPVDLPVEQPTKFELVINLKTAKQIGVTISESVLYRADKVLK